MEHLHLSSQLSTDEVRSSIHLLDARYFSIILEDFASEKTVWEQQQEENSKIGGYTIHHWILFGLFAFFYFFYVGAEVAYGSYITTFAVRSKLSLTKQVGAEITAIFWGSFAAMRFASIFAAIYLRPIYVMVLSCCMSGIGKKHALKK